MQHPAETDSVTFFAIQPSTLLAHIMTVTGSRIRDALLAVVLLHTTAVGAAAQESDGVKWENATELSFVSTGGNTSSNTLGLKSSLSGQREEHTFKLELGGIRGETTFTTRSATGTVDRFDVTETRTSALTAESYFARTRYDRAFARAFLFAGVGWDRNTFAGVANRFAMVLGFGRSWINSETARFKADLGATYTIQKDVDPAPGANDGFGGVRLSIDALRRLSADTDLSTVLIIDENVEDTRDLRADLTNSLTVSLSESLALKTSLQLLFDNEPSLLSVPLVDAVGGETGARVRTPGDKLDSVLTLTLVIKL